jgi:hypothetical protein
MSRHHFVQLWQFYLMSSLLGHVLSLDLNNSQTVDITLRHIVVAELHENSVANYQMLRLYKYNRTTQIMKGDFEVFTDLDNSYSVSG